MAENKTQKNKASVTAFVNSIKDTQKKKDCKAVLQLWKTITKLKPVMWGDSIVGFGDYHYKYKSGREGDFFLVGFSPRKTTVTIYAMNGWDEYKALLKKIGPYKLGSSCLYIKTLEGVHLPTLKTLMTKAYKDTKAMVKKNCGG